jgi:hypothetical protein
VEHESLPETFFVGFRSHSKPYREDIIAKVIHEGAHGLLQDFGLSSSLGLPLVQEVGTPFFGGAEVSGVSTSEIAAGLRLPYLGGVDAATLVSAMRDERASFEKFRAALRAGVKEYVETSGETSPERLRAAVVRDVFEPAIADIENRLNVARRALSRKSAASALVGTALVTVGILSASPLAVGAGITALASPLLDVKKYYEERGSVEQESALYFLWHLGARNHRRH